MIRLLLCAAIAFAAVKTYPDGFVENEFKSITVDIISEARAQQLFESFKADESIPFGYPIDGCYARATAMARIAESENIQMAKIYAEGVLRVKDVGPFYPEVTWGFHVAPIIGVKQKNGKTIDMVFDPGLFDRPVTVDEWIKKMQAPGEPSPTVDNIYYGSRFQHGRRDWENSKNNWHTRDLERTKTVLAEYKNLDDMLKKAVANREKSNPTPPPSQGVR